MRESAPLPPETLALLPCIIFDVNRRLVIEYHNRPGTFRVGDELCEAITSFRDPQKSAGLRRVLEEGGTFCTSCEVAGRPYRVEASLSERRSLLLCLTETNRQEQSASLEILENYELNRRELEVAVRASGVGIWKWDPLEDRVTWDERMRQITGLDTPLSLPQWVEQLTHPDDRDALRESASVLSVPGPFAPSLSRIVRPSGEVRWVLSCGTVHLDEAGRATSVVGGTLDVTDQHRLTSQLQDAQRMEAVAHLTAGVAHNFNNMLMIIIACLENLDESIEPGARCILIDAQDAAVRAQRIVLELMTFAGQQYQHERVPVRASSLCRRTAELSQRSFPKDIGLHMQIESDGYVEVDENALAQVIDNILQNAKDALVDGGTVDPFVRLIARDTEHLDETWLELTICDNGPGIPETVLPRIFEPFVTTKRNKGTGLGLATARSVIEQHGGQIACTSKEGEGTTFFILLPLANGAALCPKHV